VPRILETSAAASEIGPEDGFLVLTHVKEGRTTESEGAFRFN